MIEDSFGVRHPQGDDFVPRRGSLPLAEIKTVCLDTVFVQVF